MARDVTLERKLPQNLEAERSVLGAILLDNESFRPAVGILETKDFFLSQHRKIFGRMLLLSEERGVIDLVTLNERLERAGELEAAGGMAYLSSLVDGVPRVSHVEHYARIVKQKALLRKLIHVADVLERRAFENSIEPAALAQEFSLRLKVLGSDSSSPARNAERVDGAALLRSVEEFILRFVVLPPRASLPLALWVIATHCFDAFDCFSYLLVRSPTPRCGKTRLLEVIGLLAARAQATANLSEAVLFRLAEAERPTLLLDEAEGLSGKTDRAEALRGLLNAGNRRNSVAIRCVGREFELKKFKVYCPKVIAGVGRFPAALLDRSIVLEMKRRTKGEHIARFRFVKAEREGEQLRERMAAWVQQQEDEIALTYGASEIEFLQDRDAESWGGLLSVLSVADPARGTELRDCAKVLCGAKAGGEADDSLALQALSDALGVWGDGQDHMLSRELVAAMRELEEAPWSSSDRDLSARKLAKFLRWFGIHSRNIWLDGGRVAKGYMRAELEKVFARYSPEQEGDGGPEMS